MAIQAIIFDFDSVIVESVDVKTWAFQELFKDEPEHHEAIVAYHKANGGISRMVKIRHIYASILNRPLRDDVFNDLCLRYSRLVVEQVKACPYVTGALEFLKAHRDHYDFYVVSGTPQDEIKDIVTVRGLSLYFKGVHGSPKTKDAAVREILAERGITGKQAVIVGDALADFEAARANGAHFVARVAKGDRDIFNGKEVKFKLEDLKTLAVVIEGIGI